MGFLTPLMVREDVEALGWILVWDLVWHGTREDFTVPQGFSTDFASVPRLFWGLFPPYGRHTRAAVVHDWLYHTGRVSRADADGIFRRIMRECGVGRARRWIMYLALRLFGRHAWCVCRGRDL